MRKIKIHIPKHYFRHHTRTILYDGIISNPRTRYCSNPAKADWIFLTAPKHILNKYKIWESKIILIDFEDSIQLWSDSNSNETCSFPHRYYFKRSIVDKVKNEHPKIRKYNQQVYPITFSIKSIPYKFRDILTTPRVTDISLFFGNKTHYYRSLVSQRVSSYFKDEYCVHNGIIGLDGSTGRNSIQENYYQQMKTSKIVVTCNPDNWEGDYRLFEALSCGCLVFCDQLHANIPNPLIHKRHLIYYNRDDLDSLLNDISYYLENSQERQKIAQDGYLFAKKYHGNSHRIDEILKIIRKKSFK